MVHGWETYSSSLDWKRHWLCKLKLVPAITHSVAFSWLITKGLAELVIHRVDVDGRMNYNCSSQAQYLSFPLFRVTPDPNSLPALSFDFLPWPWNWHSAFFLLFGWLAVEHIPEDFFPTAERVLKISCRSLVSRCNWATNRLSRTLECWEAGKLPYACWSLLSESESCRHWWRSERTVMCSVIHGVWQLEGGLLRKC